MYHNNINIGGREIYKISSKEEKTEGTLVHHILEMSRIHG